jgi:hypothetical protein
MCDIYRAFHIALGAAGWQNTVALLDVPIKEENIYICHFI